MRVVVEIFGGVVSEVRADEPCTVLIIDRDNQGEDTLADGQRGYVSEWEAQADATLVDDSYRIARWTDPPAR